MLKALKMIRVDDTGYKLGVYASEFMAKTAGVHRPIRGTGESVRMEAERLLWQL